MLEAKNIHKNYGDTKVLKGVDVQIQKGEIVSIVGPSGSGKSTLLHILGTLDQPQEGAVSINGQPIDFSNDKALALFRNEHIGFVFQFHHLLPEFTALENVCVPAWIANKSRKTTQGRALMLLERLGVAHRKDNKPGQMSGGEQQRVAVARALINQPSIVFADEPSGNLDVANAGSLHQLFFELRNELHQTFLIVTHNDALAQMSDRVLRMKDGGFDN
uniref:ABC transporter ATP-binding protein n=1 Tax=Gynurincola endophyticus TaxID=2479004 RepID=UPI0018F6C483